MTERIEYTWNLDGFVDEQRYYCSETPIDFENLPAPKAVLDGDVRTFIDYSITLGAKYHVVFSSYRNGVGKFSDQVVIYAFSHLLFKINSEFNTNFSDKVGANWSAYGNSKIEGGWLVLDGSSDYLNRVSSVDLNLDHPDDLTLRFKIKPGGANPAGSNIQVVLSKRSTANPATGFEVVLDNSVLQIYNWSSSSASVLSSGLNISLTTGVESEVSFERKSGSWYAYKDGVLVSTATQTGTFGSNTSNLTIGRSNNTGLQPARDFKGSVRNLQLIRGLACGGGQSTTQRI